MPLIDTSRTMDPIKYTKILEECRSPALSYLFYHLKQNCGESVIDFVLSKRGDYCHYCRIARSCSAGQGGGLRHQIPQDRSTQIPHAPRRTNGLVLVYLPEPQSQHCQNLADVPRRFDGSACFVLFADWLCRRWVLRPRGYRLEVGDHQGLLAKD